MKIILTKEELLDLCSRCSEIAYTKPDCEERCIFGDICGRAYVDLLRDKTEVTENDK